MSNEAGVFATMFVAYEIAVITGWNGQNDIAVPAVVVGSIAAVVWVAMRRGVWA